MFYIRRTSRQDLPYDLLPTGQTINVELYLQQLERVQQAMKQNGDSIG